MSSCDATLTPAMVPAAAPRDRLSGWSILKRIVLLIAVVLAVLGGLAVWSFWPRSDTRALRSAMISALPGRWNTQFQIRGGGFVCGLLQGVAALTPAPAEAADALGAVDSIEVSLAQSQTEIAIAGRAAALSQASALMSRRGWEPTVSVLDGEATVAVFTQRAGLTGDHLRVCTMVLDHRQLVVANVELDPAPLARLVERAISDPHSFGR